LVVVVIDKKMTTDFAKAAIKKVENFCDSCTVKKSCYVSCREYNKALLELNEELKSYHPNKYMVEIDGRKRQYPDWSF